MLTSDKLILVELHKAGSARVKKLLAEVVGGESTGKLGFSDELAAAGKPVVGYVCNPLTWYLALWRQGCTGKGDVHKRLADDSKWTQMQARRTNMAGKEGSKPDAKRVPDGFGSERARSFWYADAENPEAFREWLQAVAGVPGLRKLVSHGYGTSPVNRLAGLMTYEFMVTFVRNAENMEKSVNTMEALEALQVSQSITSHFVRSEFVSEDLKRVLGAIAVPLSTEQSAAVDALKERSGADAAAITRFYDAASLRLVAKREALINKLFGYSAPAAGAGAKKGEGGKKAGGGGDDKPKLSKAEREQKRQARAEKQAAKGEAGGAPKAGGKNKAATAAGVVTAQAKPAKTPKAAAGKAKTPKAKPAPGDDAE
jgi:hypothetical protein